MCNEVQKSAKLISFCHKCSVFSCLMTFNDYLIFIAIAFIINK